MIIFVSGPMTGIDDYNWRAFKCAETELSYQGHTVLSPANNIPMTLPEKIPHEGYIAICLAMIDQCDAIYQLKGWENSKGARIEFDYASRNGKTILQEVTE